MQRTVLRSHSVTSNLIAHVTHHLRDARQLGRLGTLLLTLAMTISSAAAAEPDNVLLDFTATWCGPCQAMSSIVSRLERQGFPIRKVDVDQEPGLAAKFRVRSIPCFVLVSNGQEVDRVTGGTTEAQLRQMLNKLPRPQAGGDTARTRESERGAPRDSGLGVPIPLHQNTETAPPTREKLPGLFGEDMEPVPPPADPAPLVRGQSADGDPMRSSVRFRVKDGNNINFGSGTIIDSQAGQAIVLTCAHIFRKISASALIEVDLNLGVKSLKPETVTGRVLVSDAEADVALVAITVAYRLPVTSLGFKSPLAVGDKLFSIGCGGGDLPTRENVELTRINKYRGPENLECTMRPQQGRSGGGLFRQDELVGICVLADPRAPRGIYCGLQPVALILEKAGLTHLLPRRAPTSGAQAIAIVAPPGSSDAAAETEATPPSLPALPGTRVADADAEVARLLSEHLGDAAPQDLAGAEIICIVRSRVPGQPSRVVIVNQASNRFVSDLLQETTGERGGANRRDSQPVETSLERTLSPRGGSTR